MYVTITKVWQMQKENITTVQQIMPNVTYTSMAKAGSVSKGLQAQKWQLHLQGLKNVVRRVLPGWVVVILQWLRV